RIYTNPTKAKEQEPFTLYAEFEDPAAGVRTETFEWNLTWASGLYTGWQPVTRFREGYPAGLTEIELQPGPLDGKDTFTYNYTTQRDYNWGVYQYVYVGKTSTSTLYKRKGFIQWDLGFIPSGYNVTNATMILNFGYAYNSGSATTSRWYGLKDGWVEGTKNGQVATGNELTWNNMPEIDYTKEVSSLGWPQYSNSGVKEYPMNISIVQDWIDDPSSNNGIVSKIDNEDVSNIYCYGYFWSSDYPTESMRPKLVLEFDKPLPAILPRGIIDATTMIPDDHPKTGTPWDNFTVSIQVRDDDLGFDSGKTEVTVNNVEPEVIPGMITPKSLIETPDMGIPEGTYVTLENFQFDDVAYDVWSELDYGFNYSIDWGEGDGPSPWMNDFRYTGSTGPGSGGGASGQKTLVIGVQASGHDQTDALETHLTNLGIPYDFRSPSTVITWTAEDLLSNYYAIWIGCEAWASPMTLTDTNMQTMLNGGIIEEYVRNGGIFVANSAHNQGSGNGKHYGPGTSTFWRYSYNGINTDNTPVVSDTNHEYITGTGYSGATLTATNFANWGTTCHGVVTPPAECSDSGGVNLGTSPNPDQYNDILWSNANSKAALLEYTLDGGYCLIDLMTYDWSNRGIAELLQMVKYIEFIKDNFGGEGLVVEEDVDTIATAYNNGRKVVMDSKDNLYTIYTNGASPSQISVSNSSDLGETWTNNVVTTGSTEQLEPSMAIDSNDVLHAVWRGKASGYFNIRYANSDDGGETWDNFKMVTSGSSAPTEHLAPSIAVDSNDMVHIAWYGRSTSYTAQYNIHYTTRKASGGTWGSITMLTSDGTNMYHQYPSLAVDSNDDVHVVWSGQTGGAATNNIQYKMYDSSASTWSSVKMLTSSSFNDNFNPCIAVDRDDNLHIVWDAEPAPTQIKYIKYDASTSTWSSTETVSTNSSATNLNPSIGVDYRGYLYVVWYKLAQYQILMRMFDGNYWTNQINMTHTFTFSKTTYHPSVMFGGKYAARGTCLIFTADNGTAYNVYFMTTSDFNLTDYGPWKGLPKFVHLYRDDNPTKTEFDWYEITIRVRDDDTGIGTWKFPLKVYNVWPYIEQSRVDLTPTGPESAFTTPVIEVTDPGSGPNEKWSVWLDTDNSETWTAKDIYRNVSMSPSYDPNTEVYATQTLLNGGSVLHLQPISLPYNDDYDTTIGVYVYDDDIPLPNFFINITYPIMGGDIHYPVNTAPATSGSTAYNYQRNLVMDSNGNLFCAYRDTTYPYNIWVARSYDMGETWKETKLTVSDSQKSFDYTYYCSIAVDSNDGLHVVWMGRATGTLFPGYSYAYKIIYTNSMDGGKTWSNYTLLSTSGGSSNYNYYPSIAIDSKDTAHIVWYGYDYNSGGNSYYYNIRYRNRTAAGTLSPITLVTSYTGYYYCQDASLAIDSKDNVHVVWHGRAPSVSYYNIHHRMLNGTTGAWGTITRPYGQNSYQYDPSIVEDIYDNLHIVWRSGSYPYRTHYIKYDAKTSTWGSFKSLGTDLCYEPTVSSDGRGYVYVSWYGYPYPTQIFLTVDNGSGFSTPTGVVGFNVDNKFQYMYYPSLMGHGRHSRPVQGAALVCSGYVENVYRVIFYSTDDFWTGLTFEKTGYKAKMDLTVANAMPQIECPGTLYFMPGEELEFDVELMDQGSDDLYFEVVWGDGSANMTQKWYNNGATPEPVYPPTATCFNGTAPFSIKKTLKHLYTEPGIYYINMTLWDDDQMAHSMNGTTVSIKVDVIRPRIIKEKVVEILEGLLPGRMGWLGYDTLTLEYLGKETISNLLVYDFINRPPFYWETKLITTICDIETNDVFTINASSLAAGMFGNSQLFVRALKRDRN
ncbi:MAG: exo-alpha-sialidase, partial [Planctomycetota bacterium]